MNKLMLVKVKMEKEELRQSESKKSFIKKSWITKLQFGISMVHLLLGIISSDFHSLFLVTSLRPFWLTKSMNTIKKRRISSTPSKQRLQRKDGFQMIWNISNFWQSMRHQLNSSQKNTKFRQSLWLSGVVWLKEPVLLKLSSTKTFFMPMKQLWLMLELTILNVNLEFLVLSFKWLKKWQ